MLVIDLSKLNDHYESVLQSSYTLTRPISSNTFPRLRLSIQAKIYNTCYQTLREAHPAHVLPEDLGRTAPEYSHLFPPSSGLSVSLSCHTSLQRQVRLWMELSGFLYSCVDRGTCNGLRRSNVAVAKMKSLIITFRGVLRDRHFQLEFGVGYKCIPITITLTIKLNEQLAVQMNHV